MGAIEIKELHIKINVDNDQQDKKQTSGKGNNSGGVDKDMIITECVEQIMEIISKQSER